MPATFELFNLFSPRPDWILKAREPRLRLTGTVIAPALPGPSVLHVTYVDEPRGRVIASNLEVRRVDVARVHVAGSVEVEGTGTIEIVLDAALVT